MAVELLRWVRVRALDFQENRTAAQSKYGCTFHYCHNVLVLGLTRQGSMGASSAGLGCGTTVYFELPLFSAATAGKQPLAPLIPDYPPQPEVVINDRPMQLNDRDRELYGQVMATPERMKPRPSTPPLTGSAIYVVDTVLDEGDVSPSYKLRQKPKRGLL